jgi:hypothetical protein
MEKQTPVAIAISPEKSVLSFIKKKIFPPNIVG